MATLNRKSSSNAALKTHEGSIAKRINPLSQLKRSVLACMLWEDTFYEDGESIAERIAKLVSQVTPHDAMSVAILARNQFKLRHVPLLIAKTMASLPTHKHLVSDTLNEIIQRPDELAEYVSIYWKDGRKPLSAQSKKGLARAFQKFSAYQLAKYNRDKEIKLKDVLFLCHAKPKDVDQAETWKQFINNTLSAPDTWEVNLSAGNNKKLTFERLIKEGKLGALALLRNLRNMHHAGVPKNIVGESLNNANFSKVLPFRFISAAKAVPAWEDIIEPAMFKCLRDMPKLSGKTALVIDCSGSMVHRISGKSDLSRSDTAAALAILIRELSNDCVIIGFSDRATIFPPRNGFALRDSIHRFGGGFTDTAAGLRLAEKERYDRVILITDEQSHTNISSPKGKGYCINVACYENGIGYGKWLHIDGWSEAVIDYIMEYERAYETRLDEFPD